MTALLSTFAALTLFAGALVAGLLFAGAPDPDPSPDLSPEAVVKLQVEALQANGEDNAGIATAFRFASPGNRAATGPLARFTQMVRSGYADMLGFERAVYGRMVFEGNEAAQRVTLIQADGRRSAYVLALSKQTGGAYDGCWMTDAVVPVEPEDDGMIRT